MVKNFNTITVLNNFHWLAHQAQNNPTSITEKYISPYALPNEQTTSWLKWKEDFVFDTLVLRTEADVRMIRFLNTSQDVYEMNPDPFKGEYIIKNSWLAVKNFFGFQCYYSHIPETDRKIAFHIDFILDGKVTLPIELDIDIIVPNLVLKTSSKNEFVITEYEREYSFNFYLEHIGKAAVKHTRGFIEIVRGSKDLNIEVIAEGSVLVLQDSSVDQSITITGTGYAMIRIGYEYEDYNENKYTTNTLDFILNKRIKEKSSIPIKKTMQDSMPLITSQT